ncbi:AAA family ATPase [Entomobacter blattae]|uniref:ATPase family n=1 Tax=Entomobacter blattae TaxID=2762277 RepID=A0A7H1NNC6_9PROT|nr:MoxR family ATPase [Entomobacter blattae]QNT77286.1 ATPase family [Entomobacter blattae]
MTQNPELPSPAFQKPTLSEQEVLFYADQLSSKLVKIHQELSSHIFGQDIVIEQVLTTMLSGGHCLLVGVPGLGKTYLIETLSKVMGLSSKRIQFTPDLMPSDITGSEILDESPTGQRSFRFVKGPVFCQLLLADEINRASPRTQSALLQAMQEQTVTIAGAPHPLPHPFHVMATQNPLEQEGTYPLPEAQLDRFLLQVNLYYPDEQAEKAMILATTSSQLKPPQECFTAHELLLIQTVIRSLPVGEKIVNAILKLVRMARPETSTDEKSKKYLAWGPGPRATQAFMLATRARALLDGRLAPSLDDVAALAIPILRHRMALHFSARTEGIQLEDIIGHLVETILQ